MPIYSHSRISAYESCPLKYRYRYIDKIRTGKETIEPFLGLRVHETLEKLYRDVKSGLVPSLPDLLSHLSTIWDRRWHSGVRIVRPGRTAEDYRRIGRACVETYYKKFVPFDQDRTIGLEHRILIHLDSAGDFKLQGYIDRLAVTPEGVIEIHDYKTSESLPTQTAIDSDRQLALYQMGVQDGELEVHRVRLVWHYLRHGETLTSEREPKVLADLRRRTLAQAHEIEGATDFPPRETRLCAWCEYLEICPVWKGRPPPTVSRGRI
ncbi:MAG: PD-(D/E)XK nuclease family protein [Planctomycetota bacterium]|nr:PD-(D/E)XK nuclease family protein [Planctomycetota bacterium]